MNSMTSYIKLLWQRLSSQEPKVNAEVERIAVLQQTAASRRAEYAEEKERAERAGDPLPLPALIASRKRMEDAESAHTAALQTWENKQSRQKSR